MKKNTGLLYFFLFCQSWLFAQQTQVDGRVTDAQTGEPIGFASVVFLGSQTGTTTDFEGYYSIQTNEKVDSLSVHFLGYQARTIGIQQGRKQQLNIQLEPSTFELGEVEILPGRNPAYRILDSFWEHRSQNDPRSLRNYSYESYTRIQIDVDNISEEFREKRIMKPFAYLFDSLKVAAGENGNPVLPVFVSESLTDVAYSAEKNRKKEVVKGTNISGVGMEDGTFISQFVGSSLVEYNFYQDQLTILERNVISPLARESKGFYLHILEDSLMIGEHFCYQIRLIPKREEDVVFNGTIWVSDTTFHIVKLALELTGEANLNFVERFKIQQELYKTPDGPTIPERTRILLDIQEPGKKSFGILAKYYTSNRQIEANREFPPGYFDEKIEVMNQAQERTDSFWLEARHDSLSRQDLNVFDLVDSVRSFPRLRTYVDVIKVVTSGYFKLTPKIELGSYLLTYGQNVVEGHRFRAGFRTTGQFSKQWMFRAYGAYGLRDQRFKYGLIGEHFLSRKSWTKVGLQYKNDIEGIGVQDDYEQQNALMEAASQIGLLDRLNRVEVFRGWFHTDLHPTITQRFIFTHKSLRPEGNYNFAYFPNPETATEIRRNMRISELAFETRWAPGETKLVNDNKRTSINVNKAPAFTFRYTLGMEGLFGSDFTYHKIGLKANQIARLGYIGRAEYIMSYNKVFTPLPYLLLNIFPGNETPIRTLGTFNMMNFFEFVADESVQVFYVHHFDGFLMNRVRLMSKLKWRLVGSAKMAWGRFGNDNLDYLPEFTDDGLAVTPVNKLDPTKPYMEVGYGFENVFRFLRIQAFHRLNYLDRGQSAFAIKGSVFLNF